MNKTGKINDTDGEGEDSLNRMFARFRQEFGYDFKPSNLNTTSNEIVDDAIKTFDELIEQQNAKNTRLDFKLDHQDNRLIKKILTLHKKEGENKLQYLKSKSPDIIDQIKKEYQETKSKILIDDIMPLVDNLEFIDLVVEKKIPFKSLLNNRFSESLCTTLLYLSNKKGLGKGGNPYIGEKVSKLADEFALRIAKTFDELDSQGFDSLKKKADELNSRGIKTHRNSEWTKTAVSRVIKRLEILDDSKKEASTPSKGKVPKPD